MLKYAWLQPHGQAIPVKYTYEYLDKNFGLVTEWTDHLLTLTDAIGMALVRVNMLSVHTVTKSKSLSEY